MKKSFTENLTVSRESILAAYDNADVNGRELLEHLFGAESFVKNITEQVKTFRDACYVLGDEHPLVKQYQFIEASYKGHYPITDDSIAYLKLRIINTALNGGWEPRFTEDEPRYYPWFALLTQKEFDRVKDDNETSYAAVRASSDPSAYVGLAYAGENAASSCLNGSSGSRLAFKTRELAEYAGRQFIGLYADFMLL